MSRIRYHLTDHAHQETIPLRTGMVLKSKKVFLDQIEEDLYGTQQQTVGQRDRGNYHILANIWLDEVGEEKLPGRWRIVTNDATTSFQDQPIITIIPFDRSDLRSEANLTDFLKKERMAGDKHWLTIDYIAKTLHPMLKSGQIRNQNDLADIIRQVQLKPIIDAKINAEKAADLADKQRADVLKAKEISDAIAFNAIKEKDIAESMALDALEKQNNSEKEKVAALKDKQEALNQIAKVEEKNKYLLDENELMRQALIDSKNRPKHDEVENSIPEPARRVTAPWPSKTSSNYMNIGIEATVVDVEQLGANISLTYIDKFGRFQTVTDFGYHGFVQLVYDYLKSCKDTKRRAVFILTYKPDLRLRLAADTMMLATYVNLWRNH